MLVFGGDVYISDVPVDNSSGIGSEAEGKLNAIDSVVSEGFYFGDIDHEAAIDSICRGYLSSLGDKYTTYYSAEQYKRYKNLQQGLFMELVHYVRKRKMAQFTSQESMMTLLRKKQG